MKPILRVFFGLTFIGLAGCSTGSLFPPEVTRDMTRPEFGVLEAKPDVLKGRVVQLAGRIIGNEESADGTMLLVQELPVDRAAIYGPSETDKPTSSFVLLYPGKVDQKALWFGNKLIAVVVAQGEKTVAIDNIPREKPYVIARCMHVWKTGEYGSYGVDDFPHLTDGYYPLEQQTYCAN
jgi:starvation-inducible outer membrane lipoprotein